MLPVQLPPATLHTEKALLHYWALQFQLDTPNDELVGGYVGLQTNGRSVFGASHDTPVINFSIWRARPARAPANAILQRGNPECKCDQIQLPFVFEEDRSYRFVLDEGPSGSTEIDRWWGLWVTDVDADSTVFVGEVLSKQHHINTALYPMASWAEDLHWWHTIGRDSVYVDCSRFDASSLAVLDVLADSVAPNGTSTAISGGNTTTSLSGRELKVCRTATVWRRGSDVQHNLGYWEEPPKNVLKGR